MKAGKVGNPMFSDLKAILFDLDGTLVDTDNMVVEKLAERLRPILRGNAERTARWLLMRSETPGNMLVTVLDRLGLDERMMGFTDNLRRRRGVYPAHEFQLVPGVEETILTLSQRYKLGLVTSRSRYHIDRFLAQFPALADTMEATCGLQDSRWLKPHASPVRLAAHRLGVSVSRCLMVGDTTVDIKAGRRAGAWSAGVLCGFGQRAELEKAGAHVIVDSTADLSSLL